MSIVGRVSLSELTAASTGTSCPARSFVSNGVMMMAPIVEHLYEFQQNASKDHETKFLSTRQSIFPHIHKFDIIIKGESTFQPYRKEKTMKNKI